VGARLLLDVLADPPAAIPQPDEGATLAPRIDKAEAHLDVTQPAAVAGTHGARLQSGAGGLA
jgi:methionyl-tRNA formyltransferase